MKKSIKIGNFILIFLTFFITCVCTKASTPKIEITKTISPTKTSATIVINATSEDSDIDYIEVSGHKYYVNTYTFKIQNKYNSYNVIVKDKLGNESFVKVSVPELVFRPELSTKITYSDDKKHAYCSIECKSDGSSIDYILVGEEKFYESSKTVEFDKNGNYRIECFDVLGNTKSLVIIIDKIQSSPKFKVEVHEVNSLRDCVYITVDSYIEWYNSITCIEIDGEKFMNKTTVTKTVYLNGDYGIKVTNEKGLTTERIVSVTSIVYPPKIELSKHYNNINNTVTINIKALSNGREIEKILVNDVDITPIKNTEEYVEGVKYYVCKGSYIAKTNGNYLVKALDSFKAENNKTITVSGIDDVEPEIYTILISQIPINIKLY